MKVSAAANYYHVSISVFKINKNKTKPATGPTSAGSMQRNRTVLFGEG